MLSANQSFTNDYLAKFDWQDEKILFEKWQNNHIDGFMKFWSPSIRTPNLISLFDLRFRTKTSVYK